MQTMLVLAISP